MPIYSAVKLTLQNNSAVCWIHKICRLHFQSRENGQCHVFCSTHTKISHLVTSLSTSRQQAVFALLVTSCQQVWNKLLTICNNLVDIIRLVILQGCSNKSRYSHDIAVLSQSCVVNLVIMTVSDVLEQSCDKSDNAIKLVTSC